MVATKEYTWSEGLIVHNLQQLKDKNSIRNEIYSEITTRRRGIPKVVGNFMKDIKVVVWDTKKINQNDVNSFQKIIWGLNSEEIDRLRNFLNSFEKSNEPYFLAQNDKAFSCVFSTSNEFSVPQMYPLIFGW